MTTSQLQCASNSTSSRGVRPVRRACFAPAAMLACAALVLLNVSAARAGNLWWDANGTSNGAGTTPTGIWGTDSFWSTSSAGTATPGGWTSGETAVFSAGTDATGMFTVTLSGVQTAGGLTFEEGTVTLADSGLLLGSPLVTVNPGAKATIISTVSGSAGLTKAGVGELVLSSGNSFTGGLLVQRGTLTLNDNNAASTGGIIFTNLGNSLFRSTVTVTLTNAIDLGLANGNSLELAAQSGQTLTLDGQISNSHGWNANGAGTIVLGGSLPNTFGGTVNLVQGTLVLAKNAALGDIVAVTTVSSGTTLGFTGDFQYTAGETIAISGTGVGGLGAIRNLSGDNEFWGTATLAAPATVSAESGSSLSFIGSLNGAFALTKSGAGQIDLFNTGNNFTTTHVTAGTFGVWFPANAGTGLATVDAGATLVGNGDIPGGVLLNGTIAVGDQSPDQLDSGSQTWNAGGSYIWKINAAAGTAGTDPGHDWLNITGGLTLSAMAPGAFVVEINSLNPSYLPGDITGFNNTQVYNWTIASTTTGITDFDTNKFTLDDSNFSNDQGGGRFVILTSGNDLVLRFDPPPVITVCTNVTQTNDLGQCSANVSFAVVATDNNLPGVTLAYETNGVPVTSPAVFPEGATAVDVVATDSVGNTDTCSFNVTVVDVEPPAVLTQNITIQLDATGNTNIAPTDVDNGSTDNCGPITLVSVVPSAFTYCNVGANNVTLTVVDAHGNTNTGMATVTVNAPVEVPAVVYVDDDYPGTCGAVNFPSNGVAGPYFVGFNAFPTIQAAVDAVAVGGTVHVAAGTYNERVVINKAGLTVQGAGVTSIVTGTSSAPGSGVTPSVFKVAATGVTVRGFKLLVNLAYNHSGVHSSGTCTGITVSSNTVVASGTAAFSYGLRNAIAINPSGVSVVGYTSDSAGYSGVSVVANTIEGTLPGSFFRAGIQMDLCGGAISGNTSTTINHDFITRFANQGDILVSGNTFLGGGANIGSFNPGAGTVTVTNNIFDNNAQPGTPTNITTGASLRLIYYAEVGSVNNNLVVAGNTFMNHRWGISVEDFKNVTFDDNTFTPKAGATDFVHISFNTKIIASTSAGAINMFPVGATLTRNVFEDSGVAGGTALAFYNHRSTDAVFGTYTIGTVGNENEFSPGISRFVELDASSGASTGWTLFGGYGSTPSTTMAPWSANLDVQNNKFDVGSGLTLPSVMNLADLFAVEDRVTHKLDNALLGLVRVKATELFVTSDSGSIQRGIDAATAGDTVNVNDGTYDAQVTINKAVTLLSANGPAATIITNSAPAGLGTVQFVGATTGAQLGDVGRGFTINGIDSPSPAVEWAAVYFQGNHSGVSVIGNTIVAAGDAGLTTEFGAAINGLTVSDNTFIGQTFVGLNPADYGFANQFSTPNVPRQLVLMGGGPGGGSHSNITFTCNTVAGTAGGTNISSQPQGNTLVTIDCTTSIIQNNAFSGLTTRFAESLRVRGPGATVSGNTFDGQGPIALQIYSPASATAQVNSNSFEGTYGAALVNGGVQLAAEFNWWAHISGPNYTNTNPGGLGGLVAGLVDVSPWLGSSSDQSGACGLQPDLAQLYYAPDYLEFSVDVEGAYINSPLSPQPVVRVIDENDEVATQFNGLVVMAISSGTPGASLSTVLTQAVVNGEAVFSGLQIDRAGDYRLEATTAAPIDGTLGNTIFSVSNYVPTVTALSPAFAVAGDPGFTLTVTGTNFVYDSTVKFGTLTKLPLTVTPTTITVQIDAADIASVGSADVTVVNVAPGGGESTPVINFPIYAVPTVVNVDDDFTLSTSGWGYDHFATIQEGVNRVIGDGSGTVNVAGGTYAENLNLNKPLNLLGAGVGMPCAGSGDSIINGGGGSGTAITIAANDVTVDGFAITGITGVTDTGFTGAVIQNNQISAIAVGIAMQGVAGAFTVQDNCVTLAATEYGLPGSTNAAIGVLLGSISGAGPQVVQGNSISGGLYGYLLADVDAAAPLAIKGGNVTNSMQGVAVINLSLLFAPANSTFTVDGVNMSGFAGTSLDANRNFHAGVYVFTGGSSPAATVVGTVTNVTVTGTGKPQQDSAGLSFADFSTGVGARQTITVVDCDLTDNANRGVNTRGSNAVVKVVASTLTGNGSDPFGIGGNDGFGMVARNGATLTASNNVIVNPSSVTGGHPVTALAAHEGAQVTAFDNSVDNNGCPTGLLAGHDNGTSLLNASGNWWGDQVEANLVPLIASGVDFTPFLDSDVDTQPGTLGFQGDFGTLHVTIAGAQTGVTGRVQEGINLTTASTVLVGPGTFAESLVIAKNGLTLTGAGVGVTILDGPGCPTASVGITLSGSRSDVTITDLTVREFNDGVNMFTGPANNILLEDVALVDNCRHGFWSQAFGIDGLTFRRVDSSRNNLAGGNGGRGIWLINGVKRNVVIEDGVYSNNGLVGIDVSDGNVADCVVTGNIVSGNGDAGIGIFGPTNAGPTLVAFNSLTNNGRFGIEIKNPTGTGLASGPGSIVVASNSVVRNIAATDGRDHAGILVMRRGPVAGINENQPSGVYLAGNAVTGYHRKPAGTNDGIGLVVGGTGHVIMSNSVTDCDVAYQVQGGGPTSDTFGLPYFDRDSSAAGSALVAANSNTGNEIGLRVVGPTAVARVEGNTLVGDSQAGIRVQLGAVVDAGDCGSGNVTGLGSSAGGNILTGYGMSPWAIENLNTGSEPNVLAYNNTFGAATPAGVAAVVYDAGDNAGASSLVLASETGLLIVAPPPNVTVECPGAVPAGATNWVQFLAQGGVASSSAGTVGFSDAAINPGPYEGDIIRTYTLTDLCGTVVITNHTITVDDTMEPVVTTWPTNRTLQILAGCDVAVPDVTPEVVAADNCALNVSQSPDSGTLPLGTNQITVTVSDNAGHSTNQVVTVVVEDNIAPMITLCPSDITVNRLDATDPCSTGTPVATDNCTTIAITYSDNRAGLTGCDATGNLVRTWTATDGSGNTDVCVQTITIEDTLPPLFTSTQTNIVVTNEVGLCSASVAFPALTAIDEGYEQGFENPGWMGGESTLVQSLDWNDYNSSIVRVTNGSDGISSKSGVAHAVIDSSGIPLVNRGTGGSNETGSFTRMGGYYGTYGTGFRSSVDVYLDLTDSTVGNNTYGFDVSVAVNIAGSIGTHRRDFIFQTASDALGNILVAANNGSAQIRPSYLTNGTATAHATVSASGWYSFEWVFKDNAGVVAVDLNLRDAGGGLLWTTNLSDPSDLVPSVVGGNRYMWFTYVTPEKLAIDNAYMERNSTVISTPASGSSFAVGTTTVTNIASDHCGNMTTNMFDVTVNDVEAPTISVSLDLLVSNDSGVCGALVNYSDPVTADNCGVASTNLLAGQASGTVFPVGITTNVFEVVDIHGNTATNSFTVTVNDTEPPTLTFVDGDIGTTNDVGVCGALVVFAPPTVGDNCGVASTNQIAGLASNVIFPVGITTNLFVATDIHGNSTTNGFTVTVNDVEKPVAVAGSIASCYTLQIDAEAAAIAATSAMDNCVVGSTNILSTVGTCSAIITVRVTDIHGNFADVSYNTRIDSEIPTLGNITATQLAQDVKDGANTVLQGVVNFTVVAGDNCSLVGGSPSLELVNGGTTNTATFTGGVGTVGVPFTYTWTVTAATAGGTWLATVSASDLCQNTNATFTLDVNKNEIAGQIELQGFAGTNRTVVFKASDSASSNAIVLQTWTVPLTFSNGVAPYKLTNVPDATLGLSAKTAWSLRRKLPVTLVSGQATNNFTTASAYLKGGDVGPNPASANKVLSDDYFAVINAWESTTTPASDITGEGVVNILDYSQIAEHWTQEGDPE